jgi:hypothetical protein
VARRLNELLPGAGPRLGAFVVEVLGLGRARNRPGCEGGGGPRRGLGAFVDEPLTSLSRHVTGVPKPRLGEYVLVGFHAATVLTGHSGVAVAGRAVLDGHAGAAGRAGARQTDVLAGGDATSARHTDEAAGACCSTIDTRLPWLAGRRRGRRWCQSRICRLDASVYAGAQAGIDEPRPDH